MSLNWRAIGYGNRQAVRQFLHRAFERKAVVVLDAEKQYTGLMLGEALDVQKICLYNSAVRDSDGFGAEGFHRHGGGTEGLAPVGAVYSDLRAGGGALAFEKTLRFRWCRFATVVSARA